MSKYSGPFFSSMFISEEENKYSKFTFSYSRGIFEKNYQLMSLLATAELTRILKST